MKGRRVYADAEGYLPNLQPGDYGRSTWRQIEEGAPDVPNVDWPCTWWQGSAPDGTQFSLNPTVHQITEHDDGTITVHPSIDCSVKYPGKFHGWLKAGEWT